MRKPRARKALLLALTGTVLAIAIASAAPAGATSTPSPTRLGGTTSVTTAPGIATTLLGKGIVPLPAPATSFRFGFAGGLNVTYGFPITGGNPNLSGPSGDIQHAGGINFVSLRHHLEIGRFDIDLAGGKIYATQVNFAPARIPVLDLDLAGLHVSSRQNTTALSGITLKLDPAAAGALNSTFGLALPVDGSLVFGSAVVTLHS